MKKIHFSILIVTIFITIFGYVGTVYAIDDYTTLAPLPGTGYSSTCTGSDGKTIPCEKTNLTTYAGGAYKIIIAIAIFLSIATIFWGGVEYMSTDAIFGKKEGKEKITRALYGLIIVLLAWLILYTINPKLVSFNLNFTVPPAPDIPNRPPPATVGSYCLNVHLTLGGQFIKQDCGDNGSGVDASTCLSKKGWWGNRYNYITAGPNSCKKQTGSNGKEMWCGEFFVHPYDGTPLQSIKVTVGGDSFCHEAAGGKSAQTLCEEHEAIFNRNKPRAYYYGGNCYLKDAQSSIK